MEQQKKLLKIVKTWNREKGYRGFRCADCQKYLHKAWHHQLNYGGFRTPVHFCSSCQKKFGPGGVYSTFTCDKCGKNYFKMYHVWKKRRDIMEETHYCKRCFLRTQGPTLRG